MTPNSYYYDQGMVFLLDPATIENVGQGVAGAYPDGGASFPDPVTVATSSAGPFAPSVYFAGTSGQQLRWSQAAGAYTNLVDTVWGGVGSGKEITLAARISPAAATSAATRMMVFFDTASTPSLIALYLTTSGVLTFHVRSATSVSKTIAGPTVTAGGDYRIAARLSATGVLSLWVNGTRYTDATGLTGSLTTGRFALGQHFNVDGERFTGHIGAFSIFSDALSDADCLEISEDESVLYATAGDPPAGTVTISAVDPGETTAEVTYSYDDSDETGFEYRIDGGTAASIGASPATITGLAASTEYDIEVRAINASGAGAWSAVETFTTDAESDSTAPVLTSPAGAATGTTTASGAVTTDEANGTLYAVVTTSATPPSAADIRAGTGAAYDTSQSVSATGVQNVAATGLTASTAYYWHFLHDDAADNTSNIATSASFTTTTSVTTSILMNNTDTPHASTSVSWTYFPTGRIGAMDAVTPEDGTGTTDASGQLTVTGLVLPGILMVAVLNTDATDDDVYYEAFA